MNLIHLWLQQVAQRPQQVAVYEAGRQISFRQLDAWSRHGAASLAAQGVGAGSMVLTYVPLGAELYAVLLALWRIGAVPVVIDPGLGAAAVDDAARRLNPTALIAVPQAHYLRLRHPRLAAIRRVWSARRSLPGCPRWNAGKGSTPPVYAADDQHPALITTTSGSTGRPKLAMRSHGFLRAQQATVAAALDHRAGERVLATLAVFALADLASGRSLVVPEVSLRHPAQVNAGRLLAQIKRLRPQVAVAPPALWQALVRHPQAAVINCLRLLATGGGPVYPHLLDQLRAVAPHTRLRALYGSTEAEPIAEFDWDHRFAQHRQAMASGAGLFAGIPNPHIHLRIIDCAHTQPLARGEVGEILVRGPQVLEGYYDGIGNNENKLNMDGHIWHRSGDLGMLDEHGQLWLRGRVSARIHDQRGTLDPFAVEAAALSLSGVEAAALAAHNQRRLLVWEGDPQVSEILTRQLSWAQLDDCIRMPIPRDRRHQSKVDYRALRRQLEQQLGLDYKITNDNK